MFDNKYIISVTDGSLRSGLNKNKHGVQKCPQTNTACCTDTRIGTKLANRIKTGMHWGLAPGDKGRLQVAGWYHTSEATLRLRTS